MAGDDECVHSCEIGLRKLLATYVASQTTKVLSLFQEDSKDEFEVFSLQAIVRNVRAKTRDCATAHIARVLLKSMRFESISETQFICSYGNLNHIVVIA